PARGPPADIDAPVKPGPGVPAEAPAPGTAPPARAVAPPARPDLIGRGDGGDGFTRVPPKADVSIPGREPAPAPRTTPPLAVPPPPESRPAGPTPWPPPRPAPATPPEPAAGLGPTPVPSCARFGNKLDNFALYRHDGEV